jgi:hypothetical protein
MIAHAGRYTARLGRENRSPFEIFWSGIAPSEHLVQIYDQEDAFMNSLEGFVGGGIRKGDGVIVIAVSRHFQMLEDRLKVTGLDLRDARLKDQYIPVDANEAITRFLVNDWPDENLFQLMVGGLLTRARGNGRRVRAFGEMVALMWEKGLEGATVRLEHLWHELCQREALPLFCAYPKCCFTETAGDSINQICAAHSKVIAPDGLRLIR